MKERTAFDRLTAICRVDDLDRLLTDRERLRHLYASLQLMYMASKNDLFAYYMQLVSDAGREVNKAIQNWSDTVQNEHGAQAASWEVNE